jgi:hypothetical protein
LIYGTNRIPGNGSAPWAAFAGAGSAGSGSQRAAGSGQRAAGRMFCLRAGQAGSGHKKTPGRNPRGVVRGAGPLDQVDTGDQLVSDHLPGGICGGFVHAVRDLGPNGVDVDPGGFFNAIFDLRADIVGGAFGGAFGDAFGNAGYDRDELRPGESIGAVGAALQIG